MPIDRSSSQRHRNFYLFIIVVAQFAGTSLWFVGNAILPSLPAGGSFAISPALITAAVQTGFIAGTLLFSILGVADRYGTTTVFLLCALIAAACTAALIVTDNPVAICSLRFLTGFFLAGIYPVGIKIAADIYEKKLGNALGFLVGALVLGTAFPSLVKAGTASLSYGWIVGSSSVLSVAGALLLYFFVPAKRSSGSAFTNSLPTWSLAQKGRFRAAMLGYFGHMWELYAFWAFVPSALYLHTTITGRQVDIPLSTFYIIASGAVGCLVGGALSKQWGSVFVARTSLLLSGSCCILFPLLIWTHTPGFLLFMCAWGVFVVADSPQFTALIALAAPAAGRGRMISLVTSAGFAITVVSVAVLQETLGVFAQYGFWILAIGPITGLIAFRKEKEGPGTLPTTEQTSPGFK